MESIWKPESTSGPYVHSALLLILFSPSISENPASLWEKGPDLGCLHRL